MTRLASVLQSIQKELSELQVEWALVGGLAVSVRAEPRFTRDVGVAIMATEDDDDEQLVVSSQRSSLRPKPWRSSLTSPFRSARQLICSC